MSVLIYVTPVYLTVPGHTKLTPLQFPRFSGLGWRGSLERFFFFRNHTFNQSHFVAEEYRPDYDNNTKQRIEAKDFFYEPLSGLLRSQNDPPSPNARAEEAGEILARFFKTCIVSHE